MSSRSSGEEMQNIRGVDVLAGAVLILAVAISFNASIRIIPELQARVLAQSSATHEQAALILRDIENLQDDRSAAYEKKINLNDRLTTQNAADTNLRLEKLDGVIATLDSKIGSLQVDLKGLASSPAAERAVSEMRFLQSSWRWKILAQATTGQLVLFLTLMMGALGGIIAVARAFVYPEDGMLPEPADYVIRPLLGAVMAFVIYMLVQVGKVTLVAGGEASTINPYSIALIAIIAGMMGREAIAALERWGRALFDRISAPSAGTDSDRLAETLKARREQLSAALKKISEIQQTPLDQARLKLITDARAAATQAQTAAIAAEEAINKLRQTNGGAERARATTAIDALTKSVNDTQRLVEEAAKPATT